MPALINPFSLGDPPGSTKWIMRVVAHQDRWTYFDAIQFARTSGGSDVAAGNTPLTNTGTGSGFTNTFTMFLDDGTNASATSDRNNFNRYAGVDFGSTEEKIREFRLYAENAAGSRPSCPMIYLVQRWDAAASKWRNRAYRFSTTVASSGDTHTIALNAGDMPDSSVSDACFWMIEITANNGSSYTEISEIEMRGSVGGSDLCTGGYAIADFIPDGSAPTVNGTRHRAFANDADTTWCGVYVVPSTTTPFRIGYAWPTPPGAVAQLAIRCRDTTSAPRDFKLKWSANFADWTTVLTVTGETWSSFAQQKTWTI